MTSTREGEEQVRNARRAARSGRADYVSNRRVPNCQLYKSPSPHSTSSSTPIPTDKGGLLRRADVAARVLLARASNVWLLSGGLPLRTASRRLTNCRAVCDVKDTSAIKVFSLSVSSLITLQLKVSSSGLSRSSREVRRASAGWPRASHRWATKPNVETRFTADY